MISSSIDLKVDLEIRSLSDPTLSDIGLKMKGFGLGLLLKTIAYEFIFMNINLI